MCLRRIDANNTDGDLDNTQLLTRNQCVLDVDNDQLQVGQTRFGFLGGAGLTTGQLYLDGYESYLP